MQSKLRRTYGPCTIDGCARGAITKVTLLCDTHYQRERRSALPPIPCAVSGCDRFVVVKRYGVCDPHYKRIWTGSQSARPIQMTTAEILRRDSQGCKECSKCRERLPESDFYVAKARPDGRSAWCRGCSRAAKVAAGERAKHRYIRYGLTTKAVEALLAEQGGCATCGIAEPDKRGWHVDHDHRCCAGIKTCGRCVRGILCGGCNWALGMVNDNIETLLAMAAYLTTAMEGGARVSLGH